MFFPRHAGDIGCKVVLLTLGLVAYLSLSDLVVLAATSQQRSKLSALTQQTAEAARQYSMNRKKNAAELLGQVVPEMIDLLRDGDAELHRLARPLFQRLQRATELLKKDGFELPELPTWDSLTSAMGDSPSSTPKVSFSGQIAPILSENCKGCHIGGRQASGGLRMDNFTQLLRGGASGTAIVPRNPEESLLIGKLTGRAYGQRMPAGGRPPLNESQISIVSQWIRQGASFDGPSPDADLETVGRINQQSQATHEELSQQRLELARERLRQAFPNDTPELLAGDQLLLIGNVSSDRLQQWQGKLQQAVSSAKNFCGLPSPEPLVRGRLTVFILRSRYDYSEFGRMVERRELPRQWMGHWTNDSMLPTIVIVDENVSEIPMESLALQLTLGAFLGSRPGMQYWFAEGIARNQVVQRHRRSDPRVRAWQQALPEALLRATDASVVIEGKLDEETLALIGMAISETVVSRGNRPKLQMLLKSLLSEVDFSEALSQTFGEPQVFVSSWLGK
jgi:hypothetical protein